LSLALKPCRTGRAFSLMLPKVPIKFGHCDLPVRRSMRSSDKQQVRRYAAFV
jgi:hypothetical protein